MQMQAMAMPLQAGAYVVEAPIWADGMGLTDRIDPDWSCHPCPRRPRACLPCNLPDIPFSDPFRSAVSLGHNEPDGCCGSGTVDGIVGGVPVKYQRVRAGCCDDGFITMSSGGVPMGKVTVKRYICPLLCGTRPLLDAVDAGGNARFQFAEDPLCCREKQPCCVSMTEDGSLCGGIASKDLQIRQGGEGGGMQALTHMSLRHDLCCPCLFPLWFGYKQWPAGATNADKILLVGMLQGLMLTPTLSHVQAYQRFWVRTNPPQRAVVQQVALMPAQQQMAYNAPQQAAGPPMDDML
jgi:hypothetical protein